MICVHLWLVTKLDQITAEGVRDRESDSGRTGEIFTTFSGS
jgi:hypothetical protein